MIFNVALMPASSAEVRFALSNREYLSTFLSSQLQPTKPVQVWPFGAIGNKIYKKFSQHLHMIHTPAAGLIEATTLIGTHCRTK